MRIVSWNCNGAFRKKIQLLMPFHADILVIPESENLEKLSGTDFGQYQHMLWRGYQQGKANKGLLILAKDGFPLQVHEQYTDEQKIIIPIEVGRDRANSFLLFAVWTVKEGGKSYAQTLLNAFSRYESLLSLPCILVGDFNTSSVLDSKNASKPTHQSMVDFLRIYNIDSVYHRQTGQEHGNETTPTHAFTRNVRKPFHLDYCFASNRYFTNGISMEIGQFEDWIAYSDHMPLIVDIKQEEGAICNH